MKYLFLFLLSLILASCKAQDCPQGINTLPMYGNAIKCTEQIAADERFFKECKRLFKNKKEASEYYTNRGWDYLRKDSLEIAIKRFNQGWLLDSANARVYWGFGAVLGKQHNYEESIKYFDKAIHYDNSNVELYNDATISLGNEFYNTSDTAYLHKAIKYLMTANSIRANDGRTYANLAKCYFNLSQKDSTRKYMDLADKLDPQLMSPELREEISN
jgi:tetratricopeptide (TPR) repeat protein